MSWNELRIPEGICVDELQWAGVFGRCRARRAAGHDEYFGRCDLKRGHTTAHALERGMEVVVWADEGLTVGA